MSITVRQIKGAKELKCFITLPLHFADRRPNQVPPLLSDERELHDPRRNLGPKDCEVGHWLAERNGRTEGWVMVIIHAPYNLRNGERMARFFQLDAVDDPAVVRALLEHVGSWARERGMEKIMGPYGFSDKDLQGFQAEGFEHPPVLATPTNAEHLS